VAIADCQRAAIAFASTIVIKHVHFLTRLFVTHLFWWFQQSVLLMS
jgi:hypothetical protein